MKKSVALVLFVVFMAGYVLRAEDSAVKASFIPCGNVRACDVPALMQRAGTGYIAVACANWPEYPYCPDVKVGIAACRDALLLHYIVDEEEIRVVHRNDGERVFEDSCVEFFCRFPGEDTYYNFEFNCAAALIAAGAGRKDRTPAPESVYASIGRLASINGQTVGFAADSTGGVIDCDGSTGDTGRKTVDSAAGSVEAGDGASVSARDVISAFGRGCDGGCTSDKPYVSAKDRAVVASDICTGHWELAVVIPYGAFFQSGVRSLEGGSIFANFHKCGSRLARKQLLTAFPVSSPKPDLHSPRDFREISFLNYHSAVD